jgi:hypothetical protein
MPRSPKKNTSAAKKTLRSSSAPRTRTSALPPPYAPAPARIRLSDALPQRQTQGAPQVPQQMRPPQSATYASHLASNSVPTAPTQTTRRTKKLGVSWLRVSLMLLGVCAALALLAWYFFFSSPALTPEQKKEAYVQSVVDKIAQIALIPTGETPQIGVISDPSTIKENKEFFRNVVSGDYLVVFPNARLMLIYSPTKNIIVNMGYAEGLPAEKANTVDTALPKKQDPLQHN